MKFRAKYAEIIETISDRDSIRYVFVRSLPRVHRCDSFLSASSLFLSLGTCNTPSLFNGKVTATNYVATNWYRISWILSVLATIINSRIYNQFVSSNAIRHDCSRSIDWRRKPMTSQFPRERLLSSWLINCFIWFISCYNNWINIFACDY